MSKLYDKLNAYRQELRNAENRHTPTAVIADEPLKNLAQAAPTTLEDMLKVNGIGKSFVSKYGGGFLAVILAEQKPIKLTMMRKEARSTLKNLQARLTNVNKRNRMLYTPKPASGRIVDVCNQSVADILLADVGSVTVCSAGSELYTQYNKLIRTTSSALRETGTNTLYAGYPFVVGKCGNEATFDVCAPLVLFPVTLENKGGKIVLSVDNDRAVTYNNALILCYNKFNGKAAEPLPPCEIEELKKREFIPELLAFYKAAGIEIDRGVTVSAPVKGDAKIAKKSDKFVKPTKSKAKSVSEISLTKKISDGICRFPTLNDGAFSLFGVNEYALMPSLVVGAFPMYSGAMQKDFDDIIESGAMTKNLTNILEGADEIADMYGDSAEIYDEVPLLSSEGNIDYINELNVSQENAVLRAARDTAFVMQGPPGTGKSQTITSIISDEVNKGKNVLIVSQKRAALSVIYSRLGRLSRYVMFVDDPKDKQAFYGKLKAMFDSVEGQITPFNQVKYNRMVSVADSETAALEAVASALKNDEYGAPMLKIYSENFDNRFKAAERSCKASDNGDAEIFRESIPEALLNCGYDDIRTAREYLDDTELMATLGEYYDLSEKYEWLIDAKKNMSSADIARALGEMDAVLDMYAYGSRSLSGRFKFRKRLKAFVKEFFVTYNRKYYKRFVKDPVEFYNGIKAYNEYFETKITADSLDFCTRLYFGTLYNISALTGKTPHELNDALAEFCAYIYIDRFENNNRNIVANMSNFTTVVSHICSAIDNKRALTKDKTLAALKAAFNTNVAASKRRGEMLRAIEGKRRPALSRFVEKFEFELFRGVRIFLMTPEAVSEILPLKNDLFDLLVFDEASQIYVERGIPAIARARRLVVCGDHKQLRPSSLGDGRVTVDDDEESDAVLEEESLLDLARFKFPEVMLTYHYRSRYEELIAFSNAAFYGGKLNISPNSPSRVPPISVHKVNGKWEDRVNRAEANKVIELIAEHLSENADLPVESRETLGVITFNAQQRDCILDLIDKKCDADPVFKTLYFEEYYRRSDGEDLGLFVKNIENVQGDERDRIIFSFAYAYNKSGVMSRNFGWLNRPGGENRLNVAISRAKRKVDIVTSIVPSDLKVDDIKTAGVHLLRKYLDYAYCISDGDRASAKQVLDSFTEKSGIKSVELERSDNLKSRVYNALIDKGLSVERDVGMGNYTVDLAIKSKNGDYVLGIECDEQALSKDISTRERDVMRRKFLASRGWTVHRVWSHDFYNSPENTVREIQNKISG